MGLEGVRSYLCFALCAGGQASPAQKQEQHLQKQLQQQLCRDSRSNSNCTRWGSSRKSSSSSCSSSSSSSNSCREPIGAADDAAAAADRRRRGSIGPSRSRQRNSSRRWAHADVGALSPQAGALIASAIRPWKLSFDTGALSPRGGSNPARCALLGFVCHSFVGLESTLARWPTPRQPVLHVQSSCGLSTACRFWTKHISQNSCFWQFRTPKNSKKSLLRNGSCLRETISQTSCFWRFRTPKSSKTAVLRNEPGFNSSLPP